MELRRAQTQEADRLYGWILEWASWFAQRGIEQWNPPLSEKALRQGARGRQRPLPLERGRCGGHGDNLRCAALLPS